MWSRFGNRKLCTSATESLRGELRHRPRFPPNFPPRSPSMVSLDRSHLPGDSRVSGGSQHVLHLFYLPLHWIRSASTFSTGPVRGGALSCWNCGEAASPLGPFLACGSCRAVQPVDRSVDYFQIFGLEQGYALEDENLESKYKEWQKKLHPDLVHSKTEKEKSYAAEQSARVIDAYRTLSKPLSRALYLLQLAGILVDEEKTIRDPELLAEMMDVREAVEEASDSQALSNIQSQIQRKLDDWSISFREAFDRQDFDSAISATQRMRYYERAIEEIVKKL